MSVTIADILTDGNGNPLQGVPIMTHPIPAKGLLLNLSGSGFAPATGPWPSDVTDGTGAFSLTLPQPSESQPTTTQWVLRIGGDTASTIWLGTTPDTSGTYTLTTLQSTYDWETTDGSDLPADAQAALGLIPAWRSGTPLPVNLTMANPLGPWTATQRFYANDLVTDAGSSWLALRSNLNSKPSTSNPDWMQLSAPGPQGPEGALDPVALNAALITYNDPTNPSLLFMGGDGDIVLFA